MFMQYFALVVLIGLGLAAVAAWVAGMAPGKIARGRSHPQADAIEVCGWFGVFTMGILCPSAVIWMRINRSTSRECKAVPWVRRPFTPRRQNFRT
jgi:hypothetical protein